MLKNNLYARLDHNNNAGPPLMGAPGLVREVLATLIVTRKAKIAVVGLRWIVPINVAFVSEMTQPTVLSIPSSLH
jgi:hypothetical protein